MFADNVEAILRWRVNGLDHGLVNSAGYRATIWFRLPFPQRDTHQRHCDLQSSGNRASVLIYR